MKSTHGGKRAGAGKPKGVRWPSTLDKLQAREFVRQRVTAALGPLVDAQIANSQGLSYLVARNVKTGKFERVTSAMLDAASDDLHERIEVWEKDPSVQAFSDLLNRALDKAKEQEQEIKLTGDEALIAALYLGRKRAAEAKKA